MLDQKILDSVFKAYDIRGIVPDELNEEFFYELGKAIAKFLNAKKLAVGNDMRKTSVDFKNALIKGVTSQGCDVIDLGEIATEMLYFAVGSMTETDGGVTVTASHNPKEWSGAKIVGKGSTAMSGDYGLPQIKELMLSGELKEEETPGGVIQKDIYPDFKKKVLSVIDVSKIKPMKLVVDAGNGLGGKVFDYLFDEMPFDVTRMYFEPDGDFPNHVPNPIEEENIVELRAKVLELKADLGIAYDGDSDRVFFIDNKGRNPNGYYVGSIIAQYLIEKHKENNPKIVHDTRLTWAVQDKVKALGGTPIEIKAGHSFFKDTMKKENAMFGFEVSSHMFYRDLYNADSAFITTVIFLEMLASSDKPFDEILNEYYEKYPVSGEINFEVSSVSELINKAKEEFSDLTQKEIDGVSVEAEDWRFNLRGSNTQPVIRLNMEARSKEVLEEKLTMIKKFIEKNK